MENILEILRRKAITNYLSLLHKEKYSSQDSGISVNEPDESDNLDRNGLPESKNYDVTYGRSYSDLPCRDVIPLKTDILAADTGPEGGLQCLSVREKEQFNYFLGHREKSGECIAGINDWNKSHHKAYGLSQSLYEVNPETRTISGEPNADAFAVVARENNGILVLADGVNWGEKAFMAARSAVRGCVDHLNSHLGNVTNTHDIFRLLLRSFQHAQSAIIKSEATLTTLCAAIVCKLQGVDAYPLCVVNVGDSLCYVYRKGMCVQEITVGSHNGSSRDMCDSGGCLGPSDGMNPDLTNLTCSFTYVNQGDIVYLTSDGISDNFDPVVLKRTTDEQDQFVADSLNNRTNDSLTASGFFYNDMSVHEIMTVASGRLRSNSEPIDVISASQRNICKRQMFACDLMKQVIEGPLTPLDGGRSAKELCANLLTFVLQKTTEKRTAMENDKLEPRTRYQESKKYPGKLDHSTVVAYEVGQFEEEQEQHKTATKTDENKHPREQRPAKKNAMLTYMFLR